MQEPCKEGTHDHSESCAPVDKLIERLTDEVIPKAIGAAGMSGQDSFGSQRAVRVSVSAPETACANDSPKRPPSSAIDQSIPGETYTLMFPTSLGIASG